MPDLFPPRLEDLIACVQREIRFRLYVYPRRVAQRKMTAENADKEILLMQEVARRLLALKE